LASEMARESIERKARNVIFLRDNMSDVVKR
jgi:hypothetical protein